MREFVKGVLKTLGIYAPALRVRDILKDPARPAVNFIVHNFYRNGDSIPRSSYGGRLIDRFYIYSEATPWMASTVAAATQRFNELSTANGEYADAPSALIFMLRGPWFGHLLQNYVVACALRQLGYKVSFVVCHGAVERCGISQDAAELSAPPFICNACRRITDRISARGFDVINLNDFTAPDEDELVEAGVNALRQEGLPHNLETIQGAIRPFLLRFFYGDYRRINPSDAEAVNHLKSAIRFQSRFELLLDHVRPSCLCFFNGLFFPEHLFFKEARDREIPALFVERGMRKNTVFISLDDPACHYRLNQLWTSVKDRISDEQVRSAEAYLTKRMAGPEDPLGNKRDLADNDESKYLQLAKQPYLILFAPVTHDTASMGKDKALGDFFQVLTTMCRLAIEKRKRLVIRSHPDEMSELSASRYTVAQYLADHDLLDAEYVRCLDSGEKWDPYMLAKFADGIAIYNGTLGIELPALGYEIFNIADSNYSGKGFTVDVNSVEDLESLFTSGKRVLTQEQRRLALKYLYFYVYMASVSVDCLLDEYAPFQYSLAEADEKKQREQLNFVTERVAFLLGHADRQRRVEV